MYIYELLKDVRVVSPLMGYLLLSLGILLEHDENNNVAEWLVGSLKDWLLDWLVGFWFIGWSTGWCGYWLVD